MTLYLEKPINLQISTVYALRIKLAWRYRYLESDSLASGFSFMPLKLNPKAPHGIIADKKY
ncbi:hypothetical protein GCM10027180_14280 [Microbulbifer echini]